MREFKIGDTVRIVKIDPYWSTYHDMHKFIGKNTKIISKIEYERNEYRYQLEIDNGGSDWLESELTLDRLFKLKRILK